MTTLFLDLEKTIIHSWDDPILINEERIINIIRSVNPSKIGIYSFAIYNKQDLDIFQKTILFALEGALHINIQTDLIFTVEEIADTVLKTKKSDVRNFIQVYGKQRSFTEFIKEKYKEGNFVLIDDLVENKEISENNIRIQLINPILKIAV
ncbi:MAG: hypothetical protein KBA66_25400 [Leptospiraceae bacterium]|nr:hypothetical protein [Leptospiraceae bacterium]